MAVNQRVVAEFWLFAFCNLELLASVFAGRFFSWFGVGHPAATSTRNNAIHCAVVGMGGYVRMSELTAEQRSRMYVQERANMVAANTVGQQQYLQVIRQQNHGFAVGQDTDVRMEEGEHNGESENDLDADDPAVAAEGEGPWTPLINMFRDEINKALRVENFRDASGLQRIILIVLDNLNAGHPRVDAARN